MLPSDWLSSSVFLWLGRLLAISVPLHALAGRALIPTPSFETQRIKPLLQVMLSAVSKLGGSGGVNWEDGDVLVVDGCKGKLKNAGEVRSDSVQKPGWFVR